MTFTHSLSTNNYGPNKFVVSADVANGTHTTIQAAVTAASSGDNIFIRQGTYTEDITLKAGITLTADSGSQDTPNVTIVGKMTFTGVGMVTIANIRLQTNSDYFLEVSGSSASILLVHNCYLNCTNNTGILYSSSSSSSVLGLRNCTGDVGTTGITLFTKSSAGTLSLRTLNIGNTGNSTTASTISAGGCTCQNSTFEIPFSCSGTGGLVFDRSQFATSGTTCFSNTSSATTIRLNLSLISSGSAVPMTVDTGSLITASNLVIKTTNAVAVSGAGTFAYTPLSFNDTGSNITTTTQTIHPIGPSMTVGSTNSGATNLVTIKNDSNTASSGAGQTIVVAGGTADDPYSSWVVTGGNTYSAGVDNSSSDVFRITNGANPSTGSSMIVFDPSADTTTLPQLVLKHAKTSSSGTVLTQTWNVDNTSATSHAVDQIIAGGSSAGDPSVRWTLTSVQDWSAGIDNSDSDAWVLSASSALGTTNVMRASTSGQLNYPLQPAFSANLSATASNVTGDATAYTILCNTEQYDVGSNYNTTTGTFTAPVTGKYRFAANLTLSTLGAGHTSGNLALTTTSTTYNLSSSNYGAIRNSNNALIINASYPANMTAGDTATLVVTVSNSTKTVNVTSTTTYFSGYLEV